MIAIKESPCINCNIKKYGCHIYCDKGKRYISSLKNRNNEIKMERVINKVNTLLY